MWMSEVSNGRQSERSSRADLERSLKAQESTTSVVDVDLWDNPDFVKQAMAAIGRRGGSARHPRKGFGSLTQKQRRSNALNANAIRWSKVREG